MTDIKNIVFLLIAALLGLGAGYLLFKPKGEEAHVHEALETEAEAETIYTCSMHPQIRQNEPGLCPICEMELVPVAEAGEASSDPLALEMTHEAVRLADVQTTVIGDKGKASKALQLTGKIESDERRTASQAAHVPGRIEKLYVTFTGEQVQKGQRLAEIYSPELATAQEELLEALQFEDTNPRLVEAAREKLRRWKIPAETIEKVEKSGKIQEVVTVYADASGIVRQRFVSVGDYVKEGESLFSLADLSRLWVLFDAYEEDLAHIDVGDRVRFTVPVLPGQEFSTRITYIDPVIDPQSRTAALRAEVSNPSGKLKPEMFVQGTIQAREPAGQQLLVPKSAVLWTGPRSVAYVKRPNTNVPTYEFRELTLGEALGSQYLVKDGLSAGEEVVTHGAFAIDAAAQLNNQASMMNRNVQLQGAPRPLTPDFREEAPAAFKNQLEALVSEYLKLKDALVATDPEKAAQAAQAFQAALGKVDMSLVQGAAHDFWMDKLNGMRAHADNIAGTKDVEEQRKQFDFLSILLIETLKAFGTQDTRLYIQHCPMAFDDRGADWISREEQILNPYFGEKMLKCGVVKDTLIANVNQ